MEKSVLETRLASLEEERKILLPFTNVSFKSKEEGTRYIEKNYQKLNRLNEVENEIKQIEWELMTPEQRAKREEEQRLSKLKREGKLF